MDNKTAIIFIGIQACGKSTFYRERFSDIVHINLDTIMCSAQESCHSKSTNLSFLEFSILSDKRDINTAVLVSLNN